MFRKRALQITVVKKNKAREDDPTFDESESLDPEQINNLITGQIRNIAIAAVVVIGTSFVLHTLSEIAINAAKPKNR